MQFWKRKHGKDKEVKRRLHRISLLLPRANFIPRMLMTTWTEPVRIRLIRNKCLLSDGQKYCQSHTQRHFSPVSSEQLGAKINQASQHAALMSFLFSPLALKEAKVDRSNRGQRQTDITSVTAAQNMESRILFYYKEKPNQATLKGSPNVPTKPLYSQ